MSLFDLSFMGDSILFAHLTLFAYRIVNLGQLKQIFDYSFSTEPR